MLSRVLSRAALSGRAARLLARPVAAHASVQSACAVPAMPARRWVSHTGPAEPEPPQPEDSVLSPLIHQITPKLLIFNDRAGVETRIHAIIQDLFEHKLNRDRVYSYAAPDVAADAEASPVFRVEDTEPFSSLGLDSLDVVELMVRVERDFRVELTDEEHENVNNVRDVIDKIHNHPRAR